LSDGKGGGWECGLHEEPVKLLLFSALPDTILILENTGGSSGDLSMGNRLRFGMATELRENPEGTS